MGLMFEPPTRVDCSLHALRNRIAILQQQVKHGGNRTPPPIRFRKTAVRNGVFAKIATSILHMPRTKAVVSTNESGSLDQ